MSKATAIFYITKSNISLVTQKNSLQKLDIKPLVVNQEILDLGFFIKSLAAFIAGLKVKKAKTLILVDQSLTYDKEVEEKEITEAILNQFSQELPFDPKELEITYTKGQNKNTLIATNKYIYQSLIEALRQNDNEVESVIPAKYVSLHETDLQTLSFNDLLTKVTATAKIEGINFRQSQIDLPQSVHVAAQTSPINLQQSIQSKTEKSDADPEHSGLRKHSERIKYLLFAFFALTTTAVCIYIAIKSLTR